MLAVWLALVQADMAPLGLTVGPAEQVIRLAKLTKEAGLDGVVCSAQEARMLKQQLGADFKLVTPGIRPARSELGDQRRVLTPAEACAQGSDYLVIGRPITQSVDPALALQAINNSLIVC